MITFHGDRMHVRFDKFDLDQYAMFLKTKKLPESVLAFDDRTNSYTLDAPARFARMLGIEDAPADADRLALAPHLFDYQAHIAKVSFDAKRYAVWADCGLGKTAIFLEWSRLVLGATGGRVLILSPLAVIPQTVEEAKRFYGDSLPIRLLQTRDQLADWCQHGETGLAISNYQKLIPGVMNEMRHLAGIVLDESSVLKSGGGVIKWNLIKSCKGVEYKLSCTATPAPNDIMEYASQASFLEKLRTEGEILWTFFTKIGKSGVWTIKPHARGPFYRFMAGWSIYLRSPAAYGWTDNLKSIPPPTVTEHSLPMTAEQEKLFAKYRTLGRGLLYDDGQQLGVTERIKLSQIAKGFLYRTKEAKKPMSVASDKPAFVADLATDELAAGRQTLVWTVYDREAELIEEKMHGRATILTGKTPIAQRAQILERFRIGEIPCLISKASLLGFGMNMQHCRAMVFSGITDSYEQFYQQVRRAYRYGQTESVQVHIPFVPELEGTVYRNVLRKQANFETAASECERLYLEAMRGIAA